jgi:hypothetical protein
MSMSRPSPTALEVSTSTDPPTVRCEAPRSSVRHIVIADAVRAAFRVCAGYCVLGLFVWFFGIGVWLTAALFSSLVAPLVQPFFVGLFYVGLGVSGVPWSGALSKWASISNGWRRHVLDVAALIALFVTPCLLFFDIKFMPLFFHAQTLIEHVEALLAGLATAAVLLTWYYAKDYGRTDVGTVLRSAL